jgi:nuclear pore complex protein Nup214
VRTKDLIEASKEAREKGTRCAQDCCVADVPLPGVSLIALSHDESVLAACTDTEIQFFSLASLRLSVFFSVSVQNLCMLDFYIG